MCNCFTIYYYIFKICPFSLFSRAFLHVDKQESYEMENPAEIVLRNLLQAHHRF